MRLREQAERLRDGGKLAKSEQDEIELMEEAAFRLKPWIAYVRAVAEGHTADWPFCF